MCEIESLCKTVVSLTTKVMILEEKFKCYANT